MTHTYREQPLFFDCDGLALLGVIAVPQRPADVGVVIVVGGPQYRVGSHRAFTQLARALAEAGIACLRFDLRGMGDSEGERIDFEQAAPDIHAAVDALCARVAAVRRVVLWGLCDGAAASAFYAATDPRIAGLALFNPWVRTEAGAASATLRHYYGRRVLERAFWRKLAAGGVNVGAALASAWRTLRRALRAPRLDRDTGPAAGDLPARVAAGLARHSGPTLIGLSGRDTVAAEFDIAATRNRALAAALARSDTACLRFAQADHTFSSASLRAAAAAATIRWLRTRFAGAPPAADPPPTEVTVVPRRGLAALAHALRTLGWGDGLLYLAARGAAQVSAGRLRVIKYRFVAAPVPAPAAASAPRSGARITIEHVHAGAALALQFPRPAHVIARRFAAGATCLAARIDDRFAGYVWLQLGPYDEDEVRCRYVTLPAGRTAWDFDVYVDPAYRMGRLFVRLWDAAHALLRERGVEWSLSRISAFNAESLRAHARFGARAIGSAIFVCAGRFQLTLASVRPFVHIALDERRRPRFALRAPPAATQAATQTATPAATPAAVAPPASVRSDAP